MSDDHHEVQKNPEYDGPTQHCLPPPVEDSLVEGLGFTLLIIGLVLGAAYMGWQLLL